MLTVTKYDFITRFVSVKFYKIFKDQHCLTCIARNKYSKDIKWCLQNRQPQGGKMCLANALLIKEVA